MNPIKFLFSLVLVCFSFNSFSQGQLPAPRNIKAAFAKGTRTENGKPGNNYWQNYANYDIKVNFVPETRLLSGTVIIDYTNNSPDTLKQLVFKLYPNIYKAGAMRAIPFEEQDISKGMAIQKISINNELQNMGKVFLDGANMTVPIKSLLPKNKNHVEIDFSYTLNSTSHLRTGEIEPGAYFIAYFFPRITVYDDIDGWNMAPYLGTYEFYNDFSDFKVAVSVPKNYVVWATGDLTNSKEVLSAKICQKIKDAEQMDAISTIIDSTDLKNNNITADNPINTFIYKATNVTDFVFATSNHYIWQASSLVVDKSTGRRTRVDAVYNPAHKDYYHVINDARKTVEMMSFEFPKWPYPYNHETVFDGLDEMEYPMMVNDKPIADRAESIQLTSHEIFHTIFPFYMGTNETKYGWMDEGWATIGEWIISTEGLPGSIDEFGMSAYEKTAGTELDAPIMTLSTMLQGIYYQNETSFFINSYPKPGLGYLYIKDMLGDEVFYKGLHHYIRTWNGKHPLPWDFFYSMNEGAGKNMNWFWKAWFFDTGFPDLGISSVSAKAAKKEIIITSKGTKPVPIDLTITYTDGSTEKLHRSIAVWEKGMKPVTLVFNANKHIQQIVLGSLYVPDVDKKDNLWMAK
jgi:hypothetical protein